VNLGQGVLPAALGVPVPIERPQPTVVRRLVEVVRLVAIRALLVWPTVSVLAAIRALLGPLTASGLAATTPHVRRRVGAIVCRRVEWSRRDLQRRFAPPRSRLPAA
jgi:hypothetical protein